MFKILRNAISHMEDETSYVAMSKVYLGTTLKKKSSNIKGLSRHIRLALKDLWERADVKSLRVTSLPLNHSTQNSF